ncbi:MAG: hypothetical protein IKY91_09505 [Akkermansia sp.]|nr:hypothetical protein [Akkermansia sp.]
MNNNLTEIVFILDRSGSMDHIAADTIGGYNTFIEKQKQEPGEAKLTTVLFDSIYEVIHDGVDIQKVEPLTSTQYWARGMTALMDAVGRTINSVGERLAATPEEERPGKVIFVITTDGLENASREFTRAQVKQMIEHQTSKYDWQFMFLGANIDAAAEAVSMGIDAQFAANYSASDIGTESVYATMDCAVSTLRATGSVSADWADSLC